MGCYSDRSVADLGEHLEESCAIQRSLVCAKFCENFYQWTDLKALSTSKKAWSILKSVSFPCIYKLDWCPSLPCYRSRLYPWEMRIVLGLGARERKVLILICYRNKWLTSKEYVNVANCIWRQSNATINDLLWVFNHALLLSNDFPYLMPFIHKRSSIISQIFKEHPFHSQHWTSPQLC